MSATDAKYEHEYLIKYKSMSYLHVQWLSAAEIGKRNCSANHSYNVVEDVGVLLYVMQYPSSSTSACLNCA